MATFYIVWIADFALVFIFTTRNRGTRDRVFMEIIQKYSNSFITVAVLLSLLPSLIHASEKSRASVYLCTDSEIILPSSTLHEKITTTKHLIADLSLLVTDEDQLYFKRLFKNQGLFYSPVTDMGDSRFDVVTFENSVLAISTKIGDEIQNERYLCERHDELTTIFSKQGSDWPAYLTQ